MVANSEASLRHKLVRGAVMAAVVGCIASLAACSPPPPPPPVYVQPAPPPPPAPMVPPARG
jgi:hypothetical protein